MALEVWNKEEEEEGERKGCWRVDVKVRRVRGLRRNMYMIMSFSFGWGSG